MRASPRLATRFRGAALATIGAVVAGSVLAMAPAQAATRTVSAAALLAELPVRSEQGSGYASAKFGGWSDADSDRCDTREEVLAAEARGGASKGCRLGGLSWRSPYDGSVRRDAKSVVVESLVPRAEAWQSGAREWTSGTRAAFANDLSYGATLLAASRSSSEARRGREPQAWLPGKTYRCEYVGRWVAVKWRWQLAVDKSEKAALTKALKSCGGPKISRPSRARVSLVPKPVVPPVAVPVPPPNDSRFDTCAAAAAAGFGPYLRDRDPEYAWYRDDDGDGTACEVLEALRVVPSTEWRTTRFVGNSQPQIHVEASNPEGGQSHAHARILDAGVEVWRGVAAGGGAAPNVQVVWVPNGTLADGRTYTVQAWGSSWSADREVPPTATSTTITTDLSPPPPTVTGASPYTVSSTAGDVVAFSGTA